MERLIKIESVNDIFPGYRDTPVGRLIEYHNLGRAFNEYSHAEILVVMCMDNRKQLRIPRNFAYIMRTGGANLRYNEFQVSYAIGVGRVEYMALIGHTNCAMVNIEARKDKFIMGLVEVAGWEKDKAEEHYRNFVLMYEIGNELDFLLGEVSRFRLRYPKIVIVPLMYRLEDNLLYLVRED